ncbi:MAG: sigma-70 family RNA polymerase sigma factor [Planctomycetes bacterium]|nr:sigma-70 family RNA polymerase sigma factor [Planctomycetota bacterium]
MRSNAEQLKVLSNHSSALADRGWRLAWSLLRHRQEAEDVVQEAFQVAVRKIGSFPTDDPWPWFGTVIAKLACNARRKHARRASRTADDQELLVSIPDQSTDPTQATQRSELLQRLADELENLPDAEREALVLTHIGGLSFRQAARAMGVPEGSFPHCVRRGTERLRRALGVPEGRTAVLLAALPVPAMPAGLGVSVSASLSRVATSATSKLLTGAVMFKAAMLLIPVMLIGAVSVWALESASAPPLPRIPQQAARESASPGNAPSPAATPAAPQGPAQPETAAQPPETAETTPTPTTEGDAEPPTDFQKHGSGGKGQGEQPTDKTAPKPEAETAETDTKEQGDAGTDAMGELGSLAPWDAGSYIRQHAFTPDGSGVIAGGDTLLVRFDAATGKRLWSRKVGDCPVDSLVLTPDSKFVVTSGSGTANLVQGEGTENTQGAHICVWNAATGVLVGKVGNSGPGYVLGLTPDGKKIVGAANEAIHVWDLASRKLVRKFAFFPRNAGDAIGQDYWGTEPDDLRVSADGRSVLAWFRDGGCSGRICAWDLATGTLRHNWRVDEIDPDHEELAPGKRLHLANALGVPDADLDLELCCVSPDGKSAVCCVADMAGDEPYAALFTLDLASGDVRHVIKRHADTLALSADGKVAVACGARSSFGIGDEEDLAASESAIAWNPLTGKVASRVNGSFSGSNLQLDADGVVAAVSEQTQLEVFLVASGKPVGDDAETATADASGKAIGSGRHKEDIHSLVYSADGRSALSADGDGRVIHWNLENGTVISQITAKDRHSNIVSTSGPAFTDPALFSADGKCIITRSWGTGDTLMLGGADALDIWDARKGKRLRTIAPEQEGAGMVAYASASAANRLVLAGTQHGVIVLDIDTGRQLHRAANPPEFTPGYATQLAISADGMHAWVAADGKLAYFDMAKGTAQLLLRELHGPNQTVVSYTLGDGNTYTVLQEERKDKPNPVSCLRLTPDGGRLLVAFARNSGIVLELDAFTGAEMRKIDFNPPTLRGHPVRPEGANDRDSMRRHSDDIRQVAEDNRKLVEQHRRNYVVFSRFDLAADGRHALVAGYDNKVHLLDLQAGSVAVHYTGHTDTPGVAAISPDGTRGLSGGADKVIRVWDLTVRPARNPVTGK